MRRLSAFVCILLYFITSSFSQEKKGFQFLPNLVVLSQIASIKEAQVRLAVLCDIYEFEPSADRKNDYIYSEFYSDYYLDWTTQFVQLVINNAPPDSLLLLDRKNISTTLEEMELQNSGIISDATKIRLGEMLGANFILNVRGYIINAGTSSMVRITYTLVALINSQVVSSDLYVSTTKNGVTQNVLNGVVQE